MYIDSHCHLFFKEFDKDRRSVITNAKKAGVKRCIVPGVDTFSSRQAIELARTHPGVIYASVGFHPYEAQQDPDISPIESFLRSSPANPIVAIGECGLDYHIYKGEAAVGKKDRQKRLFEDQLLLALKYNLPVIMHCRDAFEDFFNVLDILPSMPRGVIHCFSGALQELQFAKERHLFVGVDGNVTYSKSLAVIASQIPLSMLLLETDAPYLTPVPHRGQRNEPKYIPYIAKHIAELQQLPVTSVASQTTQNAIDLFHLI